MRVSILGASGKVGRQALQNIIFDNRDETLELVLIAPNADRIKGILADIHSAASLSYSARSGAFTPTRIAISNDIESVAGSDLIIMSAGRWPSIEEKKQYFDHSGRLAQSHANSALVRDLSMNIQRFAPDAHVVVVTNQSDMMARVARKILAPEKVLGMGGMVDSARFRMLLTGRMSSQEEQNPLITHGNHIIGFHDSSMILLKSSLTHDLSQNVLNTVLEETRAYGATVSKLQKDFNFPNLNSGSYILPGFAISSTIQAFSGQIQKFEESFNIHLDNATAKHYGVSEGDDLSVPVKIGLGQYVPSLEYHVSTSEMQHLKQAQKDMAALYTELTRDTRASFYNGPYSSGPT